MRICNYEAGTYAARLREFTGSNLYSRRKWVTPSWHQGGTVMYTVFSYSRYWPLYVNFLGVWYENGDYSSRTTSKHREDARPTGTTTKVVSCAQLRELVEHYVLPRDLTAVEKMFA